MAKYNINERHQLIDLNKELTNFKLSFECESADEYKVYITNQNELEMKNLNELPMKTVKGKINGNIVADKNEYNNYFMILQSDKPTVVTVKVNLEPIHIVDTPSKPEQEQGDVKPLDAQNNEPLKKPQSKSNIFMIIIWIIIFVLLGYLIYIFYFQKKISVINEPAPSIIDDINNI